MANWPASTSPADRLSITAETRERILHVFSTASKRTQIQVLDVEFRTGDEWEIRIDLTVYRQPEELQDPIRDLASTIQRSIHNVWISGFD